MVSYCYLKHKYNAILDISHNLKEAKQQYKECIDNFTADENKYYDKLHQLNCAVEESQKTSDAIIDKYYQEQMNSVKEKIQLEIQLEQQKKNQKLEEFAKAILESEAKANETVESNQQMAQEKLKQLESIIADKSSKVNAAVEAAKRAEEMKDKVNFYRINLPKSDISEIGVLRSIEDKLRSPEALNKTIWKIYYEHPVNDLINRVIGPGTHIGIYKITHIESQRCYVGQSLDLSARWKQHIKRGIGADTPTKNKLYPAMKEYGPENFTFEVIEECDKSLLDSREDYWQDYFKAKEFGYSIK